MIINVYVLNAASGSGWSTDLARWGPRVRIPSLRFLFYCFVLLAGLDFIRVPGFFAYNLTWER